MKFLLNIFKFYRFVKSNPWIMTLIEKIFELIEKSQKENTPLAAEIQIGFNGEGPAIGPPMASLWVCRGEGNPIDRMQEMGKALEEIGRYARKEKADGVAVLIAMQQIENIARVTLKRHAEQVKSFSEKLETEKTP